MTLFYIKTDFNYCGCMDEYRVLFEDEEAASMWADEKADERRTEYDIGYEDEDGEDEEAFIVVEEYEAETHDSIFYEPYKTEKDQIFE